jgi:hypothetical protein
VGTTNDLIKAIKEFKPISKNGKNPFFKSEANPKGSPYALLEDIQKAIMPALNNHGFFISSDIIDSKALRTAIMSGPAIVHSTTCPLLFDEKKNPMQSLGSAITYATKYNLQMLFCLDCDSDDDGNASKAPEVTKEMPKEIPNKAETLKFKVNQQQFEKIIQAADKMDIKKAELLKLMNEKYKVKGGSQLNQEQYRDLCSFVGVEA